MRIQLAGFIEGEEIEIYLYTLQGQLLLQQHIFAQPLNTITLNTENFSAGDLMLVVKQEQNSTCLPLTIAK